MTLMLSQWGKPETSHLVNHIRNDFKGRRLISPTILLTAFTANNFTVAKSQQQQSISDFCEQ